MRRYARNDRIWLIQRFPSSEQEIIEKNVRRAVGIHALRKIGVIVAEEQQADAEKAKALLWFLRFGWIVLLLAYLMGVI